MKIYAPRYSTRNAGFVFVAISIFLSLATLVFFVIVIANQHHRGEPGEGTFNWPFSLVTAVVGLVLFGLAVIGLRRLLQNEPRRVSIDQNRIVIERVPRPNQPGQLEVEIPFASLISVDQQDKILAEEAAKGGMRFKGLLFQWADDQANQVQTYRLSERDVTEFDLLIDEVFNRSPVAARGERTFDR